MCVLVAGEGGKPIQNLDQKKKNTKKTILFHAGWGGVAIAKTSNLNVNFLKKKKKNPRHAFL